jgi:cephalosporin hydroxylase
MRDFIASHGVSHIVLIVSDSEHTISHLSPLLPHKIYNMYISVGSYWWVEYKYNDYKSK